MGRRTLGPLRFESFTDPADGDTLVFSAARQQWEPVAGGLFVPPAAMYPVGTVYQDIDGVWRGYWDTGGTISAATVTSLTDPAVPYNYLMANGPPGLYAYKQTLPTLSPIVPVSGTGLLGQGSDGKGAPTRFPTIVASAGFLPAPSLADGSQSRVISIAGANDNVVLVNVSADGSTFADSALGGTGTNLRCYGSSFWGGAYWSVVSNGGEWRFFNTDARQRPTNGQGAWRHIAASDLQWLGGFIEGSDATHPTVNVLAGDGLTIMPLHIINQTGSGNSRFGCTNSKISTYFDGQGDTNGGAVVAVLDTGNQLVGSVIKCGNGSGTGCRAILLDATAAGHGSNLIVDGLQVHTTNTPNPNLAYLIEVNDPNAVPGQVILSNVMSPLGRGVSSQDQDTFSNPGLGAILVTAGNAPVRSNVAVNEVFV